jgi:cell division protein ZipA
MLRTILLIIGVLIILAIAFDGWRRKRRRLQQTRLLQADLANADPASKKIGPLFESEHESDSEVVISEIAGSAENTVDFDLPKVVRLEPTFASAPSGPVQLEIEAIQQADASANEALPLQPLVRSDSIKSANQTIPKEAEPTTETATKVPNVISLTVMSIKSRPFAGYDVINALKENHLHHGIYDIYHRHKYRNGKGPLYFSVASVVKPGSINPRKVGELSTPGLALFMSLDNPKHDRIVFKQILATAHQLAKTLGGVVCDDRRVPLRESSLEAYADKINL